MSPKPIGLLCPHLRDNIGGHPTKDPVHTRDFVATMYHALGYGPDTKVVDPTGRPHFIIEGQPVRELF